MQGKCLFLTAEGKHNGKRQGKKNTTEKDKGKRTEDLKNNLILNILKQIKNSLHFHDF